LKGWGCDGAHLTAFVDLAPHLRKNNNCPVIEEKVCATLKNGERKTYFNHCYLERDVK
jgi:hypothetical protein